jgi:type VI secretion system protein ImpA
LGGRVSIVVALDTEFHQETAGGANYFRMGQLARARFMDGEFASNSRGSLGQDDYPVGELRGRDVEVALGVLEPRSGDTAYSRSTVEQMMRDGAQSKPELRDFPAQALAKVTELQQLMRDRVGYASAPDFEPLITTLTGIRDVMPGAEDSAQGGEAGAAGADGDSARRGGGRSLTGSIESRNDALRAIDMVCEYLERTEPTNPAQLLLRRARKLVNKNFVELVRELAPESLNEVARVMGISAEELSVIQGQE